MAFKTCIGGSFGVSLGIEGEEVGGWYREVRFGEPFWLLYVQSGNLFISGVILSHETDVDYIHNALHLTGGNRNVLDVLQLLNSNQMIFQKQYLLSLSSSDTAHILIQTTSVPQTMFKYFPD